VSSWHFASDPEEVYMGGADVGGDGSVKWKLWGDNIKPGNEVVAPRGTHGREHQNVDETDAGNFRISIELPHNQVDADALVNTLKNLPPAVPGARVNFELPIVGEDWDQIQIRWDSRPPSPGHHAMTSMAAMKTLGTKKKKATVKKSSKKASKKSSKKSSKKATKKKPSTKRKK